VLHFRRSCIFVGLVLPGNLQKRDHMINTTITGMAELNALTLSKSAGAVSILSGIFSLEEVTDLERLRG
jgi:hypothetical protein